jgi:hypothetical protein
VRQIRVEWEKVKDEALKGRKKMAFCRKFAERFGVTSHHIYTVLSGQSWADIRA